MTVAYLIASHTNAAQVARLIARIRAERPAAPIVLHHDPTHEPIDMQRFAGDRFLRVVASPLHGEWGSFRLVEIALLGIETLFQWGCPFDYLTYISGQDYPLASLDRFESRISGDGAIVMSDDRPQTLDRYRFAYFTLPRRLQSRFVHRVFYVLGWSARLQPLVRFTSGRIGCRIGIRRSRLAEIEGIRIYKGFQWWTLSHRALRYVIDFVATHPTFVDYFAKRTLLPDEAFFQTILGTGSFELDGDDDRFMRWATPDAMNPDSLTMADAATLAGSAKAFGRKFDSRSDAAILDHLDTSVLGRPIRV